MLSGSRQRRIAEAFDPSVDDDPLAEGRPLQIAIVGRPNAGKSTLVNTILGEDRLLTGPEAGITRDSIAVDTVWEGRRFRIFDTAGHAPQGQGAGKAGAPVRR